MKSIVVIILGSALNALILKFFAYILKIEDRTFWKCFAISVGTICLYFGLFSSGIVTNKVSLIIVYFLMILVCAICILRATFPKAAAVSLMLISLTFLGQEW